MRCKDKKGHQPRLPLFDATKVVSNIAQTMQWPEDLQGDVNRIIGQLRSGNVLTALESASGVENPQMYDSHVTYGYAAQLAALIKKIPFTNGGLSDKDRRAAAQEKFWEAELICKETNASILSGSLDRQPPHIGGILRRSRRIINEILGDFTPEVYEILLQRGRHGPGSSTDSGDPQRTNTYYKYSIGDPRVSSRALPHGLRALYQNTQWRNLVLRYKYVDGAWRPDLGRSFTVQNSNRIAFVPKNAKTDRTIAVENSLNVFLQLGVHEFISDRLLKTCGINLRDQSVNQVLAKIGSRSGWVDISIQPCTIDLSMASDTISREVVEYLLPNTWVGYLDDIRSHEFEMDGRTYTYEKWSSMGNGYTFALESLIFAAIALASCEYYGYPDSMVSVFGDDIIVPKGVYLVVSEVLRLLGFVPNLEKSFATGPFRESCGADWFNGEDVRPYFIREEKLDILSMTRLINRMSRVYPETFDLLQLIPQRFRLFGPYTPEDDSSHIWAPIWWLNKKKVMKWIPSQQCYKYRVFSVRTKKTFVDTQALLIVRLEGTPVSSDYDPYCRLTAFGEGQYVGLRNLGRPRVTMRWSRAILAPDRQLWPEYFFEVF